MTRKTTHKFPKVASLVRLIENFNKKLPSHGVTGQSFYPGHQHFSADSRSSITGQILLLLILLHDFFGRLIHLHCALVVAFGLDLRNCRAFFAALATIGVGMVRVVGWVAVSDGISTAWDWWVSMAVFAFRCFFGWFLGRSSRSSLLCSLLAHLLATSCKHASNDQGCKCELRFDFHRLGLFHCLRKLHSEV